jgi:Zn-dependent peptidase ImmA (M78 family)
MLSLRHKSNDHLWFSFFHEAGHLLHHGKKLLFLELVGMLSDDHEKEADRFASDWLIPPDAAKELHELARTEESVVRFASKIGIAPGIVVGRMQKDGHIPWTYFNALKTRYRWRHEDTSDVC